MKKFVAFGIAFLSLSLSLSQVVRAENVDARSIALGGTTLGVANGAFAPLRNPAAMVDTGWGSFILPLSPAINIGANTNTFNAFIPPGGQGTEQTNYFNNLINGFAKTPNARLEAQSILPVLGFSGSPFPNAELMGRPIAFGANIWIKAAAFGNTNMQSGLSNAVLSSPALFNSLGDLLRQSGNITQQFTSVSTGSKSIPDFDKLSSVDKAERDAEAAKSETFQKDILKPFISSLTALDNETTQIKDFLTSVDILRTDQQSGKGEIAGDGHAVLALSGASRVFKNEVVDLSVGLNLKGFFFPGNPAGNSVLTPEVTAKTPILGALFPSQIKGKLLPVTISTSDIKLGPFKSITEIKNVLDNDFSPILQDAKAITKTAAELDQQLTTTIPQAKQGPADVNAINNSKNTLLSEASPIALALQSKGDDYFNQVSATIKTSLLNDLKDVKFNINQVNDVAPMGVGVDLGLQARIMEDVILGLVIENPLVVWPAKMTTNEVSFNSDAANSPDKFDPNKIFKMTPGETKDTNYNLTEPMALRFGGSYNLGKLTPVLTDAIILADVEQVFNGRPFAVHLGFEKSWMFGTAGIFGRLGGQIGGLGNVITMGIGFKGGPFNIDFGYGASNPFNPGGSNAATAALSTSLNF